MVETHPSVKEQVEQIRREVQLEGQSLATCETLQILCKDHGTFGQQFDRIKDIALQEGWRFSFLKDGSVRFSNIDGGETGDGLKDCATREHGSEASMFTDKSSVMNWWCPTCCEKISQPISFFLSPPCFCPHCKSNINMDGLHRVVAAEEADYA